MRADDPQALVRCSRAKAHFLAGKLRLQPAELRLECPVREVPPNAVVLVFREENAIVGDGEDGASEVDALFRIAFDRRRGAGCRIQQFQFGQIQRPLVGHQVNQLVVRVKTLLATGFQHVAAVDHLESVRIDAQELLVARLGQTHGQPQRGIVIEHPAGDALRILAQQRLLTGREAQFIQVMPARIAVVQADVDDVRLGLGHGIDQGANAPQVGQRARRRHTCCRIRCKRRVDRVDVEILIAAGILGIEDELRILAPEMSSDRPFDLGADGTRGAVRFAGLFHPDVARAVVGLQKRNELAVRRNPLARDVHLTEE